ncbi:uncharacterized protein [Montipora foliosa]|uniref:uncharacterized protein n=1 Tax=Montipora foliosa TaxID=591990 RepID=UPI0035F17618
MFLCFLLMRLNILQLREETTILWLIGKKCVINCSWQQWRKKVYRRKLFVSSANNVSESTVRCRYCGPRQFFCSTCAHDQQSERNQFHVLEHWKDNRFIPLFKLIDAFGNQHLFEVPVCDCESHAVTLVRCQFWPGSPERPSVGFHFKLMDLAEKLFLHSQVSVKEFSELILEMTPPLQPNFIPSLYSILNSGCFEEYRYFKYKLRYLNSFVPELYNGAECPLCPKENGILIESIDACFGLARKKAKGGNTISSRHGDLLFSDQDDVDNFVDNYPHCGQKSMDQDCNRFQNIQQRLIVKKRTNEVLRLHKMASERIFLLELKTKYAEGQAIAIKLSNQIDKVVTSMNQGLATLNGLMEDEVATFEDIKDPGGELYCKLNCSNDSDNVPAGIKKKLVQLMFLQDRCKEEKTLVKEEMLRFFTFLSVQINAITSYLDKEKVNRGLMSLLQQKVDVYKKNLQILTSMCKDLVTFPNFEEPGETYLLFSEVEVETPTDLENLYDFSLFEDLECHSTHFRGWNDDDFDQ